MLIPALLVCLLVGEDQSEQLGLRLPKGFEAIEVAGSDLANDIYALTLDPKGRVVVAGRGYIRILSDDDGDGVADRAIPFSDVPKNGAMGLLWEGDSLYAMGDAGLIRFTDKDGNDKADGPPELIFPFKTGGEHSAHAIQRGPDGWLYVLVGNHSGIPKKASSSEKSPITKPLAGAVIRLSPDFSQAEIVADGFRNAYDMDFTPAGDLFVYDSDNERCVSLPWYAGTRLYHVVPGGHYSWQSPERAETWRPPVEYFDELPPVCDLGRGSPTGVVTYRNSQFPEKYHDGIFLLDWTFGRIYFIPLQQDHASYKSEPEVFVEPTGSAGFAPTDGAVHPETGDLIVSIGGRGTRGAVYRIRWTGDATTSDIGPRPLANNQPLDWSEDRKKRLLELAEANNPVKRRLALEAMRRFRDKFSDQQVAGAIATSWSSPDPFLRHAVVRLLESLPVEKWPAHLPKNPSDRAACLLLRGLTPGDAVPSSLAGMLGLATKENSAPLVAAATDLFLRTSDPLAKREALRLVQLGVGDQMDPSLKGTVWEGYSRREKPPVPPEPIARLVKAYPTGDAYLDQELARLFGMLEIEDAGLLDPMLAKITSDSDPLDDIHTLICLARLPSKRTTRQTERTAAALLNVGIKLDDQQANRDRNWWRRIQELIEGMADRDPSLPKALVSHPLFGRPDHLVFTRSPVIDRASAASRYLDDINRDDFNDEDWTAELIDLLGELPSEKVVPLLRDRWGELGLEEASTPILAREPAEEDRERLREVIGFGSPSTIRLAAGALEKLGLQEDPESVAALVVALGQLGREKEVEPARKDLGKRLAKVSGKEHGTDVEAWRKWFQATHPDQAALIQGRSSLDWPAWQERFAAIDWSKGDAERGAQVFRQSKCLACHSGARALGPDLAGAAGRFSREDLLRAIVDPHRDISDRYRTTMVATADGEIIQGMIIYQSADGMILQTGPNEVKRVNSDQIETKRRGTKSLMPTGLLDRLNDDQIADLIAYLTSLKK
ncbi:Cytochrome c [Planctomycetes bacterium Pan216]|uniref:Cytochrome c n=1 Tax=Kolteria novifilia TaxID=2527975 RepID=A0A518BAC6_9BACT|nr:Cytochrome c [Planctomycetes bacterium Pan216]